MVVRNILFLPDFIGHPLCYNKLIQQFANSSNYFSLKFISYHNLNGEYTDIPELAKVIYDGMQQALSQNQTIIIGYSFGGLVGFELAKLLDTLQLDYILILVDSHIVNNNHSIVKFNNLTTTLNKYPQFSFIKQLLELGEIKYAVIDKNLYLFEQYSPTGSIAFAHIIISNEKFRKDASNKDIIKHINNYQISQLDTNHFDIIKDSRCIKTLKEILNVQI